MTAAGNAAGPPATLPDAPPGAPHWVLTGPTATGKSALAVELAARTGRDILSMDSMAVYRHMDIGTAKPSPAERARAPHHLLDLVDPNEGFDTARWCELAHATLADLAARDRPALFVGGTPLYLMAFFKGLMQTPRAVPELRLALEAREQAEPGTLFAELSRRDPAAAARIHARDQRRIVRALEVLELTGATISSQQREFERAGWRVPCRIVHLVRDREQLHARVKQRTERMLELGLVDETAAIERDFGFSATAGQAIGYAECRQFLRGRFKDETELRNRIRRATHQLIRRQTTWLRRLPDVRTMAADTSVDAVQQALETPGTQPTSR